MITEAIIVDIDHNKPYCTIEVPLFRTANSTNKVILTASFAITPGIYNSFKNGDKVWIAFVNNIVDKPVIFGKIYAGPTEEAKASSGAINCDSLAVTGNINIPSTTGFNFASTLSGSNLKSTATDVNELIGKIQILESEIEVLKSKIDELENGGN